MKKIVFLIACLFVLNSCSGPQQEEEIATVSDSGVVANDMMVIESTEKGVSMMKGFWYNPSFFEQIKTSKKVKENLKGNYQYLYLNEEGLIQRDQGFTSQDNIPVTFSLKNGSLFIFDNGRTICQIAFKNDSTAVLKTIGLDKDTLNLTLKKLTGDISKRTEMDQYEYLLGINTIVGKYMSEKGDQIEFKADGSFIGFDLNTEYFVEGLGYEGMDGDYEFDAISIKNDETLMSYKWTLANNILTLTEIETSENGTDFKLSSKPLIFTKK